MAARVAQFPTGTVILCQGVTAANGGFELRGPAGRAFGLRILGPGHLPMVVRDVVLDSGAEPLMVTVPREVTVFGRIRPVKTP